MHYCVFFVSLVVGLDPESVHPRLRKFAELQLIRDERYEPFTTDPNSMTEEFPGHLVDLGTQIATGKYTLVYAISGAENFVIKYKNDCEGDAPNLHPLLRDAWFTSMANRRHAMSPKVRFVSPPIALPDRPTRKLNFRLSRDSWMRCHNRNGSVRFIVVDRVAGLTITEYKQSFGPGGLSIHESVAITSHLIKYLEILHTDGIIHGNIHTENVMISVPEDGSEGLHLIDYSKSFFQEMIGDYEETATPSGPHCDPFASPWELQGHRPGMRDDLYRAFDLLARMINNRAWGMNLDIIVRMGRSALLSWRLNGSIFEVNGMSPFRATVLGVSDTTVQAVRNRFAMILEIVLSLEDINSIPPYNQIQQLLSEIHDLLSGKRVVREASTVRPFS